MITDTAVYSDEVTINAPASLVWQILTDFDRYGDWNQFCPSVKNKALEIGEPVEMMVDLGRGLQEQTEYICRIEPERVIAWEMDPANREIVYAVRTQTITPVDEQSCRYISIDEFEGEMTAAVVETEGANVERGFNLCAQCLKAHAEALYAGQQG